MGSWYNGYDLVRDIRKAYNELDIPTKRISYLSQPELLLFLQQLVHFAESVSEFCDYFDYFDNENKINIS